MSPKDEWLRCRFEAEALARVGAQLTVALDEERERDTEQAMAQERSR